jgi:hypothetical protein
MRGAAAARRRPASLPLLLILFLQTCLTREAGAQDALGDPTVEGEGAEGEEEKSKTIEVASYFTEFARQGPYPYQVCEDLPGEIGDDPVTATAR